MLSEEQIRKLIAANDSLQVQLSDANAMLASRNSEIEFLHTELSEATALRSRLEGQQDELDSMQNRLNEKQLTAKAAEQRGFELHQELAGIAELNKDYNMLLQDYAYLQSQYKDILAQLASVQERNMQLQQLAGRVGELESKLENCLLERDNLKSKLITLESQRNVKGL